MSSIREQPVSVTYSISRAVTGDLETDFDTSISDTTHLGTDGLISPCVKTTLELDSRSGVCGSPRIDETELSQNDSGKQFRESREMEENDITGGPTVPLQSKEVNSITPLATLLTSPSMRKEPISNTVKQTGVSNPKSYMRSKSSRLSQKQVKTPLVNDSEIDNKVRERSNLRNPLRRVPITPDSINSVASSERKRIAPPLIRAQTHKSFSSAPNQTTKTNITSQRTQRTGLNTRSSRLATAKSASIAAVDSKKLTQKMKSCTSAVITPQRTKIGSLMASKMRGCDNRQVNSKSDEDNETTRSQSAANFAKDVSVFNISTPLPDAKITKTQDPIGYADRPNTRLRIPSSHVVRNGELHRRSVIQGDSSYRVGAIATRDSARNKPRPVGSSAGMITKAVNLPTSKDETRTRRQQSSRIGTLVDTPASRPEKYITFGP